MASKNPIVRATRSRIVATSKSTDALRSDAKGSSLASSSSNGGATGSKLRATRVPAVVGASGKARSNSTNSRSVPLGEVTNQPRRAPSASSTATGGKDGVTKSFVKVDNTSNGRFRATRITASSSNPDSLHQRHRSGSLASGSSASNLASMRSVHNTIGMDLDEEDETARPAQPRPFHRSGQTCAETRAMERQENEAQTFGKVKSTVRTSAKVRIADRNPSTIEDEEMHDSELDELAAADALSTDSEHGAESAESMATVPILEVHEASFASSSSSSGGSSHDSNELATSQSGLGTAQTTPWLQEQERFCDPDTSLEEARIDHALDPEYLLTLRPDLEEAAQQKRAHIVRLFEEEVVKPAAEAARKEREECLAQGIISVETAAHDDELALMGVDPEEVRDTTMVAEYAEEIFRYMSKCERETMPNPNYMDFQTEVQWYMRTTLVDWLLQVHVRYHMLPETLWVAINIIDRFLSVRVVALQKLQLVGVTSMFIAAKYEEIIAPSVDEFVFMTENGYSKEEILKGERIILSTLDFNVSKYCTPYSWLRRISKADDYDIHSRTLAKFLMEVTLIDHRFLRAKPSLIAAMSMFLAKKMLHGEWSDAFVYYSLFTEEQLVPAANLILERLLDPTFEEQFVCKKYSNKKFLRASTYAREWAQANHNKAATESIGDARSSPNSAPMVA